MPAATSAGHDRAGAVDVVGAPAAEPGAVGLLVRRAATATPRRHAAGSADDPQPASISTTWAVTSADGGSMTAPKSQKGSLSASRGCCRRRTRPSRRRGTASRRSSATARSTAAPHPRRVRVRHSPQREHHLGGVVGVGVAVVGELERPAARRQLRPAHRPVPGPGSPRPAASRPRVATSRVVGRDARVEQRVKCEPGVPHRRLAGLQPADRPSGVAPGRGSPRGRRCRPPRPDGPAA